MWNKVVQNVENIFIEDTKFLVNICVRKSSFPVKSFNPLLMRSVFASLKYQTCLEYDQCIFSNKILQKQSDDDNLKEGKNEHLIQLLSLAKT